MVFMDNAEKHFICSPPTMLFIFLCVVFLLDPVPAASSEPSDYYIDFHYTGVEDGSVLRPFNSLNEAVSQIECGDTILIKPGIYEINEQNSSSIAITGFQQCGQCSMDSSSERMTITVSEGANNTVELKAVGYYGSAQFFRLMNNRCMLLDGDNRFIIDGSLANMNENTALVSIFSYEDTISDTVFENFEIKNSTGRGVSFRMGIDSPPGNITIRNNKIHGIAYRALGGFGNTVRLEDNEIWNSSLSNLNQTCGTGGWPGVIQLARRYDSEHDLYHYSQNISINNNYIHDNWGEGIIMSFIVDGEARGNRIHDVFSNNIYIDNSKNIQVSGNHLFRSTTIFDRNDKLVGAANGISLAQEGYSWGNQQTPVALRDITIANNLIDNLGTGIGFWHDPENSDSGNSYCDISITYNNLRNIAQTPIVFDPVPSNYSRPRNGHIQNNIIENLATTPLRTLRIGDEDAWSYSHNNWTGGLPSSGQHSNSHALSAGFAGPDFNIGAQPSNFHLVGGGNNIGAGIANEITTDYWGAQRDSQTPCIGIHEYPKNDPRSIIPIYMNILLDGDE